MQQGLGVGDGFKFGCGFILASTIAGIAMTIVMGLISLIFSAAVAGLFGSLFASSDWVGQLPTLLGII